VTGGTDPSSFGYMSVHYQARLDERLSGPRYDGIKGIGFEVQVRTIVMDAWANVSHYLDYKGDSSLPDQLRRDFYALSGLFYVADQHFEVFAQRAVESKEQAKAELRLESPEAVPINLDTVSAYLMLRYPDREHAERALVSEFVEEISNAGYEDLGQLAAALRRGEAEFERYEAENPPDPDEPGGEPIAAYRDLGAARISLAMADEGYREQRYEEPLRGPEDDEQ
jgi:hypothetical protein